MNDDPYVYPRTNVLRNAPGIRDADKLQQLEADLTVSRLRRLASTPLFGEYDLEHLRAFHRELVGGLYTWAGEIRTVDIAKQDSWFCPVRNLAEFTDDVLRGLAREDHLKGLERATFATRAAHHLGNLNSAHPFREGNGRTQRAFFSQLARDAGYDLAWEQVTAEQNIRVFTASHRGDNGPLTALMMTITDPEPPHSHQAATTPQQPT